MVRKTVTQFILSDSMCLKLIFMDTYSIKLNILTSICIFKKVKIIETNIYAKLFFLNRENLLDSQ